MSALFGFKENESTGLNSAWAAIWAVRLVWMIAPPVTTTVLTAVKSLPVWM